MFHIYCIIVQGYTALIFHYQKLAFWSGRQKKVIFTFLDFFCHFNFSFCFKLVVDLLSNLIIFIVRCLQRIHNVVAPIPLHIDPEAQRTALHPLIQLRMTQPLRHPRCLRHPEDVVLRLRGAEELVPNPPETECDLQAGVNLSLLRQQLKLSTHKFLGDENEVRLTASHCKRVE